MLLLYLAFRAPIIVDASAGSVLTPVGLPAAERAAKIAAACIAWVGEKQDLAMPALGQAFFQVRLLFENAPNNPVVLRNNTADLFLAVPIRNELKTRLYLYYKKAKCSLISLMYLGIPSLSLFCLATIKVQRGFFFCKAWIFSDSISTAGYY
ncbi:MAG: hypothetical protein WCB15_31730 [Desulfobacterales bacterium]|jgi:hypothetical protein